MRFRVIGPDNDIRDFYLGAHAPDLSDEEINFIHKLWLDVRHERGLEDIRHKQIVIAALVRLADELHQEGRRQVLDFLRVLRKGEGLEASRKHPPIQEKDDRAEIKKEPTK